MKHLRHTGFAFLCLITTILCLLFPGSFAIAAHEQDDTQPPLWRGRGLVQQGAKQIPLTMSAGAGYWSLQLNHDQFTAGSNWRPVKTVMFSPPANLPKISLDERLCSVQPGAFPDTLQVLLVAGYESRAAFYGAQTTGPDADIMIFTHRMGAENEFAVVVHRHDEGEEEHGALACIQTMGTNWREEGWLVPDASPSRTGFYR